MSILKRVALGAALLFGSFVAYAVFWFVRPLTMRGDVVMLVASRLNVFRCDMTSRPTVVRE